MDTRKVVVCRSAASADSEALAILLSQLGYTVSSKTLAQRLGATPSRETFVAESDRRIIGCVSVSLRDSLVHGPGALVESLVVDGRYRRHGVGARLIQRAADWAKACGINIMRLHCNVRREEAHRFYHDHGFALVKTQHQFVKDL